MEKKAETVRSVEKALDILLAFTDDRPQLSLPDICNKLNQPKSTIYRLLTTLESKGFIEHNHHSGKYQPGINFIKISNRLLKSFNLREKALPVMTELRDISGETINLYLKKNLERVCIEQVEGSHLVKRLSSIGDSLPLYCGASGKVLLAYQSQKEIDKVISETKLQSWTPGTITDDKKLLAELEKIREKGFAKSKGERETGVASIAAPIRNHLGDVIAALCISGPDSRLTDNDLKKYTDLVLDCAGRISKEIGFHSGT